MSQRGVGSRWSKRVLGATAAFAALLGCANGDDAEDEGGPSASVAVERASGEPEQVVQRMAIDPALAGPGAASLGAAVSARPAVPPRAHPSVPITSKHLEAELNRLEAELGR